VGVTDSPYLHIHIYTCIICICALTDLDEAVPQAAPTAPLLDDAGRLQLPKVLEEVLFVFFWGGVYVYVYMCICVCACEHICMYTCL
jgi:hypothetical protein